ncbi:IS600 orf [Shigella dysenteriae]|uniref:IS600 orf n=1 Tax=Shigella dysenteriae TaxID=622 RepID=A0A2X2HHD5_SHIDY|nr:IS600 orf [Shigella dysenteriae]
MCQVFGVSRSGYYNWVQHKPSDRKQSDERLKLEIKVAHIRTRETYGTRRLQTELAENGIIVGRDRLARLRKELRLRCKQKRKFRATTNSNHNLPVAPNLLNQTFAPTAPNQVWVADLTYVATQEGWLYLAGIKDVYTCEIVGYAMGERMTKELTGKALFMALRSQRPPAGLIHHSDRGSQYCAYDYRVIQEQFGLKTSMSRKGNCYDNAPMESFWGTLKNESLSHYRFNNRDEAISVIREYIEIFYNRQRRHSRLGNISPAAFREKYHQMAVLKKRTNGSVRYCQYTSYCTHCQTGGFSIPRTTQEEICEF